MEIEEREGRWILRGAGAWRSCCFEKDTERYIWENIKDKMMKKFLSLLLLFVD
jgi:hypothetical protein